ncbi:Pimeloyl-ACP methyl ester carboxylesterase [Catalinimonas alkaloidigena]|uniref:Pimeloyl-ACP methyl ester carboxylesterase n=1 Tax=Catalinimonas alkaloidigena TaxID=1075417 RepID=A0A1G8X626_9BACT|nr:alpha/beta hydrolase [Catalinimonas alkaloidigena]SDJ86062.1 Pimeloyl-ACP methyl ester carboxylesterase [Catalinimonas alkaloidigena]
MKVLKWIGMVLGAILFLWWIGPKPPEPNLKTSLPTLPDSLRQYVQRKESRQPNLKPDNQARIVWYDSTRKTPWSVVYLHGFSASQAEGAPIHREFARRYGCNLYLARLFGHGLNEKEPLVDVTPENLVASAAEALAIGKRLGEKVLIMSTSTGGTLALILAADHPKDVNGIIAYSPNIDLHDEASWLLTRPWGLPLSRLVLGSNYYQFYGSDSVQYYWTTRYRSEALVSLKNLLEHTMTPETFQRVKAPFFLGYYYKDDEHQDDVVSVPAMLKMFDQLGTPANLKRKAAFPEAGHHVIGSRYTSADVEDVRQATYQFAEEVLKMQPINLPEESTALSETP